MDDMKLFFLESEDLFNKEKPDVDIAKQKIQKMISQRQYDLAVTLFVMCLNHRIRYDLIKIQNEKECDTLPLMYSEHMYSILNEYGPQWEKHKKEWRKYCEDLLRDYEEHKLKDCMRYIGESIVKVMDLRTNERTRMLNLLAYIRNLFSEVDKRILTNEAFIPELHSKIDRFNDIVEEYDISFPYYIEAIWQIWNIGNPLGLECGRSDERIVCLKNMLKKLPDFYVDILKGAEVNGQLHLDVNVPIPIQFRYYMPGVFQKQSETIIYQDGRLFWQVHPMNAFSLPGVELYTEKNPKEILDELEIYDLKDKIDRLHARTRRKKTFTIQTKKAVSAYTFKTSDPRLLSQARQLCKKINQMYVDHQIKDFWVFDLSKRLLERSISTIQIIGDLERKNSTPDVSVIIERLKMVGFGKDTYCRLAVKRPYKKSKQKSLLADMKGVEKDVLIAIAIAMELSIKNTDRLLYSAGYVLSDSLHRDIVIRYMITKNIVNGDITELNRYLRALGLKEIKGNRRKK